MDGYLAPIITSAYPAPRPPIFNRASIIAVIGHGASVTGKEWGALIDASDIVIRMWDCQWQPAQDYGTKYDFGFFEVSQHDHMRWNMLKEAEPKYGWIASLLKPCTWHLPPNTHTVNPAYWEEIGKQLGGVGLTGKFKLTRGCNAALWAISQCNDKALVRLVGFDNSWLGRALTPKEGFPAVYLKAPTTAPFNDYTGGGTKFGNHDYAVEKPLLAYVAAQYGVRLVWSQEWVK